MAKVDICNLALDLLGTQSITTLDDTYSDNAQVCRRWYDITRRSLLRDIRASFSIARKVIPANSEAPLYGRTYSYALPDDCLKVLLVGESDDKQDWQIEGSNLLLDNEPPLYMKYIKDVDSTSEYDDKFVELFALKLAINMCIKITEDSKLLANLDSKFKTMYVQTSYKYGTDNKPRMVSNSRYQAAKYSLDINNKNSFNGRVR